ncbi:MAG: SDR family oxidoreductase [bacterium]|nr:SDR family oxidoreductase [bacterium]
MAKLNFVNRWVLITGASSGLGRELARCMALREGANLIITARRKGRLLALKEEVEGACGSRVEIIEADVGEPGSLELLFEKATGIAEIYALINNAGITFYGETDESNIDTFEKIIEVNFKAVMRLSLRFLAYFKQKGEGAILNVTSEAAFIPLPFQNVYSASKHAAQAFTEALHMENRNNGVVISSYAPGGIATEMQALSGLDQKMPAESSVNMSADKAARIAINSFKKKRFLLIPGFGNKLMALAARILPRKLMVRIAAQVYKPPE